jgi:hypothetical protein
VKVLLHANVTELKPDPTGRRLEEIHAQSLDGKRVSVRAGATCWPLEVSKMREFFSPPIQFTGTASGTITIS